MLGILFFIFASCHALKDAEVYILHALIVYKLQNNQSLVMLQVLTFVTGHIS